MERDWFLERLQLIAHDILTVGEREEKEKRRWTNIGPQGLSALSENEVSASLHLEEVLTQGIQVDDPFFVNLKCYFFCAFSNSCNSYSMTAMVTTSSPLSSLAFT